MQGKKVKEFENKFAEYTGAKYAIAVSSGTAALHLSLLAAGIKSGDEVICPSLSFVATANSIFLSGAKPVFADINKNDINISLEDAAKRITPKTKAIMIVHQIGYPADIFGFKKLCKENNLILIEDAACALGATYNGKKIGSHSDLVCFSFHPRKVITTGEGGMITTSRKEYYEKITALRQHGKYFNKNSDEESKYLEPGFNYRMTDIAASLGINQLENIESFLSKRQEIAKIYNNKFSANKYFSFLPQDSRADINNQSYCLILKNGLEKKRNKLVEYLNKNGIGAGVGITAIHRMPAYKSKLILKNTEKISNESILLPLYPGMKKKEINYIIKTILKFIETEL